MKKQDDLKLGLRTENSENQNTRYQEQQNLLKSGEQMAPGEVLSSKAMEQLQQKNEEMNQLLSMRSEQRIEELREEFKSRLAQSQVKIADDVLDKKNGLQSLQTQVDEAINGFRKDLEVMKTNIIATG